MLKAENNCQMIIHRNRKAKNYRKAVDLVLCLQSIAALFQRTSHEEKRAEQRPAQQKNTDSSWKGKYFLSELTGKQRKFKNMVGIKTNNRFFHLHAPCRDI